MKILEKKWKILMIIFLEVVFFSVIYVYSKVFIKQFSNGIFIKSIIFTIYNGAIMYVLFHSISGKNTFVQLFLWMVLLCNIIYFPYLLGIKYYIFVDIGSDTTNQYFPFFVMIVKKIRDLKLTGWSFNWGLGTAIASNAWLLDPFGWIVILPGILFGVSVIKDFLIIMHIIKILVSGLLCKKYLDLFGFKQEIVFLGSILYAFNGFLMLWGNHYHLGTACVYIIIMLYLIEKNIRFNNVRNKILLAIVTASILIFSIYIGYMILLFSGIYYILRQLYFYNKFRIKNFFIDSINMLLPVLMGGMISCCFFLPSLYNILGVSSRLESDKGFIEKIGYYISQFFTPYQFMENMSRVLSNNLLGIAVLKDTTTNYYELPQLFLSSFSFVIFGEYITILLKERKKLGKRKIIIQCLSIFLLLFLVLHPLGSCIFNAMAYPFGRYTFLLMPILVLMYAVVITNIVNGKKVSCFSLFISIIFSCTIILWALSTQIDQCNGLVQKALVCFGIMSVMCYIMFAILVLKKQRKDSRIILYSVISVILFTTCFDAFLTNGIRSNFEMTSEIMKDKEYGTSTEKALEFLDDMDKSFYRVEKFYYDITNQNDSMVHLYHGVTGYDGTQNKKVMEFYNKIYPSAIVNRAINIISEDNFDSDILGLLNTKYILAKEKVEKKDLVYVEKIDDIYIYRNIKAGSIANFYEKTIKKSDFEKIDNIEEKKLLLKKYLVVDEQNNFYDSKIELVDSEYDNEYILEEINDSLIEGNVNVKTDGMMCFSIPDQKGWSVYVDGQEKSIYNADYAFIAVKLSEGMHQIKLIYKTPYQKLGIVISLIGILCLIIYIRMYYFLNKKYENVQGKLYENKEM